jgi:hypothetical protein
MKLLPHFEHAVIAIEKLENYVLISSVLWKTGHAGRVIEP